MAGVFVVLASLGLVGCGNPPQPPPPPAAPSPTRPALPPRPAVLRLDKVNPCDLLTPAQVSELNTDAGVVGSNNDGLGSRDCLWQRYPAKPDDAWVARVILKQGAETYLSDTSRVTQVAGISAVETSSDQHNPAWHCLLYIDVAPGQSLEVQYSNETGDHPGLNHAVACQLAADAAQLMLSNLRAGAH